MKVNFVYLSIVIPAYNEQYKIIHTLTSIVYYLKKNDIAAEIIIVDDGSSDNTFALTKDFSKQHHCIKIVRNDRNKGKGAAVRRGMLTAKGEYILFTDADNSTSIQELKKLLSYVASGQFDIAIGSRALKESEIETRQPWFRETLGKTFNLLVRLLVYQDFKDTQCGFKCFSHKSAQEIFRQQKFNGFSFDVEILAIAKLRSYSIKEVPIVWADSSPSRVNPFTDALQMFMDIFRLKYNLAKQAYG